MFAGQGPNDKDYTPLSLGSGRATHSFSVLPTTLSDRKVNTRPTHKLYSNKRSHKCWKSLPKFNFNFVF